VSKREVSRINQIERSLKRKFTKILIPTGDEVCQQKLLDLVNKLKKVEVNEEEIDSFLPDVYHQLKDLSKEDIIKRFASIEFNRFLEYYRDAKDLNKSDKYERNTRPYDDEASEGGYGNGDRIFINVGKMDGLDKGTLLGLILDFSEVKKDKIGKIDLKGAYSFFEAEKDTTADIMKAFEGVELRGRKVRLELTNGEQGPRRSRESSSEPKKDRPWSPSGGRSGGGRSSGSRGGERRETRTPRGRY
jgi:ATP-dependent RNA helicase DeaD